MQIITHETVNNPQMLAKILNAIVEEMGVVRTLANELRTDHGTFRTNNNDLKTLLNALLAYMKGRMIFMNPGLALKSNYDICNTYATDYLNGGLIKSLAADQTFDTGTGKTIAQDKWSICYVGLTDQDATIVSWHGSDFDTEAEAIAATPNFAANYIPFGYVTVKTKVGFDWTAGTDALKTGTGGDVASETNYYNCPTFNYASSVASSPPDGIDAAAVVQKVQRGR